MSYKKKRSIFKTEQIFIKMFLISLRAVCVCSVILFSNAVFNSQTLFSLDGDTYTSYTTQINLNCPISDKFVQMKYYLQQKRVGKFDKSTEKLFPKVIFCEVAS